ncbi:MAG TPA: hypothetical protein VED41_02230 [Solirubrobacteraceae bacterium]|nr:hypothetical protein [Solirubrobacteraceae bacterium]
MAYVTARRNGRFEIRESLHTPRGPRARTLAAFTVLTDEVLVKAAERATRPFDVDAVIASSTRVGAPMKTTSAVAAGPGGSYSRFLAASRRMAASLEPTAARALMDPGAALVDLLGFADAVAASRPARPSEPLDFPVLSRLAERRARPRATARSSRRHRSPVAAAAGAR